MNCLENIRVLAEKICLRSEYVGENEQATKHSLVLPFLKCLGYDIHDPTEVHPEFVADAGNRNMDKVDYAIKRGEKPVFFVECKKASEDLGESHRDQLSKYFNNSPTRARIAILTNGVVYRFYADSQEPNRMDKSHFLEFDMRVVANMGDSEIRYLVNDLEKFTKDTFHDSDPLAKIETLVNRRNNLQSITQKLAEIFASPSDDFTKFMFKEVNPATRRTPSKGSEFKDLFGEALRLYIDDQARERQLLMSDTEGSLQPTPSPKPVPVPAPAVNESNFSKFQYWRQTEANTELHNLFNGLVEHFNSLGQEVWVDTVNTGRYFTAKPRRGASFNICSFAPQPKKTGIKLWFPRRVGLEKFISKQADLEHIKPLIKRSYEQLVGREKRR